MPEKLIIDDGIIALDVNGRGLLRFNPSDPNVYQRFMRFYRDLPGIQAEYQAVEEQGKDNVAFAEGVLDQAKEIDRKVKGRLAEVFGPVNDFDQLLDGVNVLAYGKNGKYVIENLLEALLPYMEKGIKQYRENAARAAIAQAKEDRAKRG